MRSSRAKPGGTLARNRGCKLPFEVKIIADSIGPNGKRLTTLTATYPRFIHAEIMTHRDRERNAASSRAIPWEKMRQQIIDDPVIPIKWGAEQKGMQTGGEVEDVPTCKFLWEIARDRALEMADRLHIQGVHKSLVNRIVEPFAWITVVMTATEWANFFRLRIHPDAEVHFQKIAGMMRDAINASTPNRLCKGEMHLPFIDNEDYTSTDPSIDLCKCSVARCARVSYLTHEGKRDIAKDLELFDRLVQGSGFGHWSPHGHVAEACDDPELRSGPFVGWKQYRKTFSQENLAG